MPKRKKPDYAHRETDSLIEELERVLAGAYWEAEQAIEEKLADYLRRFEIKDEKWRLWVQNGDKTEEEYKAWRQSQLMFGKRWEEMRDGLASDLVHVDEIAQALINGEMPEIYALNHGWQTYEIEKALEVTTGYTMYSPDAVRQLLKENPKLLPQRKVAIEEDLLWNMKRVQATMLQGILQGQSIPKLAECLMPVTDGNLKNAIRNARTMATGAQNAGRHDAMLRARGKGVKLRQTWLATLDMRTRHEHRILDGQTVELDEPFEVEGNTIRYPGDPEAPGFLVYNCRCRTLGQVQGFEINVQGFDLRNDPNIEGMTYEEWKESRTEKPRHITSQKEAGEAMRRYYYGKYAKK